jgi:hypothetical protein
MHWETTWNRIYPTFQRAISVLNDHCYLSSSRPQPAQHSFAHLCTAHRFFAGRPTKESQGRPAYGRRRHNHFVIPRIPRTPFGRRGFAGDSACISYLHEIIRSEQVTPQIHIAFRVLAEQIRLLLKHVLHSPPVSVAQRELM